MKGMKLLMLIVISTNSLLTASEASGTELDELTQKRDGLLAIFNNAKLLHNNAVTDTTKRKQQLTLDDAALEALKLETEKVRREYTEAEQRATDLRIASTKATNRLNLKTKERNSTERRVGVAVNTVEERRKAAATAVSELNKVRRSRRAAKGGPRLGSSIFGDSDGSEDESPWHPAVEEATVIVRVSGPAEKSVDLADVEVL